MIAANLTISIILGLICGYFITRHIHRGARLNPTDFEDVAFAGFLYLLMSAAVALIAFFLLMIGLLPFLGITVTCVFGFFMGKIIIKHSNKLK